jgi:hypothetical protein
VREVDAACKIICCICGYKLTHTAVTMALGMWDSDTGNLGIWDSPHMTMKFRNTKWCRVPILHSAPPAAGPAALAKDAILCPSPLTAPRGGKW